MKCSNTIYITRSILLQNLPICARLGIYIYITCIYIKVYQGNLKSGLYKQVVYNEEIRNLNTPLIYNLYVAVAFIADRI